MWIAYFSVLLHAMVVQHVKEAFALVDIIQKTMDGWGRKEMSAYNLEHADVGRMQQLFELYDAEARSLLNQGLPIPA